MNTTAKPLHSSPERERAIAIALQGAARDIARSISDNMSTCLNCLNFDEATETCALAKARPPARVIAYGCPSFDSLPF
jgi:predicted component of type VI protein secretion system